MADPIENELRQAYSVIQKDITYALPPLQLEHIKIKALIAIALALMKRG